MYFERKKASKTQQGKNTIKERRPLQMEDQQYQKKTRNGWKKCIYTAVQKQSRRRKAYLYMKGSTVDMNFEL